MNWTAIWTSLFGHHIPFWGQYGFLGRYGLCSADCDSDECGVLEHKAAKSGSDAIGTALNPTLTSCLWVGKAGENKKSGLTKVSPLFFMNPIKSLL